MRSLWTIARRDIRAFFLSPVAYVVLAVWLLWCGAEFYLLTSFYAQQSMSTGSENPLTAFFGQTMLFYLPFLVFVPVLTMRLFGAERESGTLETLLTAPVHPAAVVLGKYLAAMTFWVALWLPTLLYVWIISRYGDVDMGAVGASYVGVLGIGSCYMALGLLMSSVAPNQIVAAVLTFLLLGALFVLGIMQFVIEGYGRDVLAYLSVWSQMNDFSKGVVNTRYLAFDATLTVLALASVLVVPLRDPPAQRMRGVPLLGGVVTALGHVLRLVTRRKTEVAEDDEDAAERAERRMLGHVGGLLLVLITLQLNYLGYRHYLRFDWTEDERFTLSERSEEVLQGLDQEVEIYLFLGAAEPAFTDVRELLDRYEAASSRVRVIHVDPDAQPGEMRRLGERFSIRTEVSGEGITFANVAAVLRSGERRWKIARSDLMTLDYGGETPGVEVNVQTERALTGGILQVVRGRPTKICVARGHGEYDTAGGDRSLYTLREELEREYVEVESLDTVGLERVPDDCDAVYVLGPRRAYALSDARVLFAYLRDGGNLLLALDPVLERERVAETGFEDAAAELGIQIDPSFVHEVDRRLLRGPGSELFLAFGWTEHPTVVGYAGVGPASFEGARSVRAESGSGADELVRTSESGFAMVDIARYIAERDLTPGPGDIEGPVSLAVAARAPRPGASEEGETGGRIVVIGDSDWLRGRYLEEQTLNFQLAMALTGWLTEREAMISVPPRRARLQSITMSQADVDGVGLRVLVLLPGAFVLLGFASWWSRRE